MGACTGKQGGQRDDGAGAGVGTGADTGAGAGAGVGAVAIRHPDGHTRNYRPVTGDRRRNAEGRFIIECHYKDGEGVDLYRRWDDRGNLVVQFRSQRDQIPDVDTLVDDVGRDCILREGELVVYKPCVVGDKADGREPKYGFMRLRVPAEARRVNWLYLSEISKGKDYGARVEFAVVEEITDEDLTGGYTTATSQYVPEGAPLTYVVGQTARATEFDENPFCLFRCGVGIHVHRYRDQCLKWFPTMSSEKKRWLRGILQDNRPPVPTRMTAPIARYFGMAVES